MDYKQYQGFLFSNILLTYFNILFKRKYSQFSLLEVARCHQYSPSYSVYLEIINIHSEPRKSRKQTERLSNSRSFNFMVNIFEIRKLFILIFIGSSKSLFDHISSQIISQRLKMKYNID